MAEFTRPWCPTHCCHPEECFEIHYPNAHDHRSAEELYKVIEEDVETGYGDHRTPQAS